jgi:DNA mismatch endonuclease (patch repair protein)
MAKARKPLSRSEIMSRIRSRDTLPEITVRSLAHRLGFRFRLHRRDLPGTPDLVFPRLRAVLFVHGCFWHGHRQCRRAFVPRTRTDYWLEKLSRNRIRDEEAVQLLRKAGWRVMIVWECETGDTAVLGLRICEFLGDAATQFRTDPLETVSGRRT